MNSNNYATLAVAKKSATTQGTWERLKNSEPSVATKVPGGSLCLRKIKFCPLMLRLRTETQHEPEEALWAEKVNNHTQNGSLNFLKNLGKA